MPGGEEPVGGRALADAVGLENPDWERILDILGREPTATEIGIFSAMWNEHCSYKSSRRWLRTLPSEGVHVVHGPGENAGVVDIGDGKVVVFKIESHNHPSFIEPYQGAATGVGGILRDVFTMGARPVAALNALRFGDQNHPGTRRLVSGCVAGIGGYGNCFGVPTVGGEIAFDSSYDGNCLVNAFAAGVADRDKVFTARASGVGRSVAYVGAGTGRDGVGGATMASASFDSNVADLRPTVQVGDPFTEKRLCEACLELMAARAVVSIQDMGAAGLTCSAVEMGAKGGLGMLLNLDAVPCRDKGLDAFEIMLSESQERMLMVLDPERVADAKAIFEKWDLDFAVVGETLADDRFLVRHRGETVADLPLQSLSGSAPELDRPWVRTAVLPAPGIPQADCGSAVALLSLMGASALCSRRWIWEQYDHMVMADTVLRPGADAAVVRIHGSRRGLAFSLDCNSHYCVADPRVGGMQAVAESCRNLRAVGAVPLAVTDCLNFGNPEREGTMGQFVDCVLGIGDACRALGVPVVSGNVSFYNQTGDRAILPTPMIGAVGLLEDVDLVIRPEGLSPGHTILLIGHSAGHLHRSLYARQLLGRDDGPPPPVDLEAEASAGALVGRLASQRLVAACHDLSEGGLAAAAAEMALGGGCGIALEAADSGVSTHGWWFGEDQGRYLLAVAEEDLGTVLAAAGTVPVRRVGRAGEQRVLRLGKEALSCDILADAREAWLPDFMAGGGPVR